MARVAYERVGRRWPCHGHCLVTCHAVYVSNWFMDSAWRLIDSGYFERDMCTGSFDLVGGQLFGTGTYESDFSVAPTDQNVVLAYCIRKEFCG